MEPIRIKRRCTEQVQNPDTNSCLMSLNDHCLLHIIEYFELHELCTIGRTCKRMKQLVDMAFMHKFRNKTEVSIQSRIGRGIVVQPNDEHVTYFLKFIPNIRIGEGFDQRPDDIVDFMRNNCIDKFERISFQRIKFQEFHGTLIADWLSTVKELAFFECSQLHEILKHCSNLKKLKIDQYSKDPKNRWMDETYPTIEHLQLGISPDQKLNKFLIRNGNVRSLTVKLDNVRLELIREYMQQLSSISLEKLFIKFDCLQDLGLVIDQLNAICNRTDFTQLELCFNQPSIYPRSFEWDYIPLLRSLNNLVGLHILKLDLRLPCDVISEHVKVLQLAYVPERFPVDNLSNSFPNLEELYVTDLEDLQPFVTPLARHAVKLKKIVASCVKISSRSEMSGMGLAEYLNHEREKLANASRLVVYIDRDAYDESMDLLMTKFGLVQLKKAEFQLRDVNFTNPFLDNFSF